MTLPALSCSGLAGYQQLPGSEQAAAQAQVALRDQYQAKCEELLTKVWVRGLGLVCGGRAGGCLPVSVPADGCACGVQPSPIAPELAAPPCSAAARPPRLPPPFP